MSADARLLDLVERHLAGELAGGDEDELAARLRDEPASRELYHRQAVIDHHLRRLARPGDDLPLWPGVRQRLRAEGSSGRFRQGVMVAVAGPGSRAGGGAPPGRSRRRRLLTGILLLLGVAGGGWWCFGRASPSPRIAGVEGAAVLERAGQSIALTGAVLLPGDRLELAAGAHLRLDLGRPGGAIDLDGPAVLRRPDARSRLVLDQGRAACRFDLRRKAYELATPHAAVRVRGTRYRLAVNPVGSLVAVEEGTVEVQPSGAATVAVTAGHAAVVTGHGPLRTVAQPTVDWSGPGFHPAVLADYRAQGMLLAPEDVADEPLLFTIGPERQRPWFVDPADGRTGEQVPPTAVVGGTIRLRTPRGTPRQVAWPLPPLPDAFAVELQLDLTGDASISSVVFLDRYRPSQATGLARPFKREQGSVKRPPGRVRTLELFRRVGTTGDGQPIFEVLAQLDDIITNRHWVVGTIEAYGLRFEGTCRIEAVRIMSMPAWGP